MKRALTLAAVALLLAPAALAGGRKERPSRRGDAPTEQTEPGEGHTAENGPAVLDNEACTQYVVPAHRQAVELRYISEFLPRGPLKRNVTGRLDTLEEQLAGTARSLCGIRDLDRSPPADLADLDAETLAAAAGAVGAVFGQDIQISDAIIQIGQMILGGGREAPDRGATRPNTARGGTGATDADFEALLASVQAAPFADDKKAALMTGAEGKSFTCAQISQLVGAIPFAEGRVEMGVWLYGAASDPQNYDATVVNSLPFSQEKADLRAALAQIQGTAE